METTTATTTIVSGVATAIGRIRWDIQNWGALVSTPNVVTESPVVTSAGHEWRLRLYPGGGHVKCDDDESKAKEAHVALFLGCVETSKAQVHSKVVFRIVNQLPGEDDTLKSFKHSFRGDRYQGFTHLTPQKKMVDERLGFKVNDRVIIEVEIEVFGRLSSSLDVLREPKSTLQTDLKAYLESGGDDKDVVLVVGGDENMREFTAHALILKARSPFFRAMLDAPMREAAEGRVRLPDVDPAVFEAVLSWMYEDRVPTAHMASMSEQIMAAADKYACAPLKQQCELELRRGLAVGNAAARLLLAEQFALAQLKDACLVFIAREAAAVMGSDGWNDVKTFRNGALVLEVMAAMATSDSATKKRPPEADLPAASPLKRASFLMTRPYRSSMTRRAFSRD